MLTCRQCLSIPLLLPALAEASSALQLAMPRARLRRDTAMRVGDQAYGAVVLRSSQIVGEAPSRVVTAGDLTAHAEREALRDAIRQGNAEISGCELVSTSRPCRKCETVATEARIAQM